MGWHWARTTKDLASAMSEKLIADKWRSHLHHIIGRKPIMFSLSMNYKLEYHLESMDLPSIAIQQFYLLADYSPFLTLDFQPL